MSVPRSNKRKIFSVHKLEINKILMDEVIILSHKSKIYVFWQMRELIAANKISQVTRCRRYINCGKIEAGCKILSKRHKTKSFYCRRYMSAF